MRSAKKARRNIEPDRSRSPPGSNLGGTICNGGVKGRGAHRLTGLGGPYVILQAYLEFAHELR